MPPDCSVDFSLDSFTRTISALALFMSMPASIHTLVQPAHSYVTRQRASQTRKLARRSKLRTPGFMVYRRAFVMGRARSYDWQSKLAHTHTRMLSAKP